MTRTLTLITSKKTCMKSSTLFQIKSSQQAPHGKWKIVFKYNQSQYSLVYLVEQENNDYYVTCMVYSLLERKLLSIVFRNSLSIAICEHVPMEDYSNYYDYCAVHDFKAIDYNVFDYMMEALPVADLLQFIATSIPADYKARLPHLYMPEGTYGRLVETISKLGDMQFTDPSKKVSMRKEFYNAIESSKAAAQKFNAELNYTQEMLAFLRAFTVQGITEPGVGRVLFSLHQGISHLGPVPFVCSEIFVAGSFENPLLFSVAIEDKMLSGFHKNPIIDYASYVEHCKAYEMPFAAELNFNYIFRPVAGLEFHELVTFMCNMIPSDLWCELEKRQQSVAVK